MPAVADYLRALRGIDRAHATEHSYRPALKALLEALRPGAVATNEPKHSAFGAVDFRVSDGSGPGAMTVGYLECKDIGVSLDEAAKSEQLKRYRQNLPSLVLTDYLEFRWYVDGVRSPLRLGVSHRREARASAGSVRQGGARVAQDEWSYDFWR